MNRAARTTALFAVAVAATLLTACGNNASGQSRPAQSGQPSTTQTGDPRTPAQIAADKKLAEQANLQLSDFPDGWQSKPADDSSPDDAKADDALARCLHVDPSFVHQSDASDDSSSSPDFSAPDGDQTVSSNVGVTPNAAYATRTVQAFAAPSAPGCFSDYLNTELAASIAQDPQSLGGAKIGKVTVGQVQFPTLDDRTVALRFDVPVSVQGLSVDAYLDVVIIQQGRSGAVLTFQDFGSAFPTDDAVKYATIVAQRMAALPLENRQG